MAFCRVSTIAVYERETIMALVIAMQCSLYIRQARIPLDPRKRRNACHVKSRWNRFFGAVGSKIRTTGPCPAPEILVPSSVR